MAEAQQEPAGMSQLLRELEDSFQHDPQEEDTGRQLQLLLAFYDGHFVHAVHGEFSSKPMLDKLRKPNMQDGFEKLFVQVVCCLKRFQPNFEELRRDMQRHPWFSVPAPGTYFYKLGLQMDQQMALWYTCMRILHLIQCSSPYFFPRHHLGNIKGLALFRDLLVTFVAPSLRIKLNNQRGSLLPSTESPELAILCTGLHSKDLARTLRIQLMYFATHWDGCRPHEQGGLFCDLFVEGLMTIWEVALRKIGSRADAQQWQQQQQQQGERAANGDDACLGLEGLEFWQPAVDAAAWTAYVLIARRKFGVPIPHDFNRLLEVALATMQRVSLVPACGPKLPPGVAAAHVAVCALLERKEALMRANNFAVHGVALASSLRIQLNRCIADIHALLGTALPASSAAAAAPASVPAASNSSQAVQLVHQAAALLASACNFCPPSDLAITQRLANLDPQPDTPLKDSAKEVMKNFLLVNLGMLIEPMAELMLMLDAHPTKLRALVPDPLGLLLAQLKALSYSMVCSPWVTEKRDSNRWASAPPAVSQYCQATSTIAFHSDPLRLAIRAIGSCQHLLTPNAEPLSRRLPSRLAVASDVLKPLTKLHANLLWRTVMGHSCSVTSALWEEVRVFVINFIRITAPRVVSMQQQQQQQEAVKQEQKLQQEQEQQQQQQQQQKAVKQEQQQQQQQQQKAVKQELGFDAYLDAAAMAWIVTSIVPVFFFFSIFLKDSKCIDPNRVFLPIVNALALTPGAVECVNILYFALTSTDLQYFSHPELQARLLHIIRCFDQTATFGARLSESGSTEPDFPSLAGLLDLADGPFERACIKEAQTLASKKDYFFLKNGSIVPTSSPPLPSPPQRSKAHRMGLLLGALQSSMPPAIRLMVATKRDTVVDPVQCCNVDCKGSKQLGVMW
eukprot:CAMPEP_0202401238 /NCGR_PEP_ID=MMETSP1128-20130828/3341_1 /ASSEMBLY_ACC=CAM_ASM_000463 /TAXON_ID=3047 /ORGANISM="Dunaliella tertiolecta, Strain CCMP1320" /LENGTH=904 /DNA_ID=CAMNT_0049005009 /DNA_START=130 /DNA_END=2841 /DNA_ORIENTATION=-